MKKNFNRSLPVPESFSVHMPIKRPVPAIQTKLITRVEFSALGKNIEVDYFPNLPY
jgi:hypothetical protein